MQIVSNETICMKYQILFSGKNKKNIISLSSAELAKCVVKVNNIKDVILLTNIYFTNITCLISTSKPAIQ